MELSVVIPLMNEQESVDELINELSGVLQTLNKEYEILLVDDGSTDKTWQCLVDISKRVPCLELIRFRRNFGQTAAMAAGFQHAQGEIIIAMDGDLQNDPASIPDLLEVMDEDVDVVSGWRKDRQDTIDRRLPSMLANRLISKITGVSLHDYGCSLKAYRKDVLDNVRLYGEMHRFIPALASWAGGHVKEVVVNHRARKYGEAKYGIGRTIRVILDLITVKFLIHYSKGPMQLFGKIGFLFGVIGVLFFAVMLGDYWFRDYPPGSNHLFKRPAWVITPFMLILFSVQFISMGLLAEIQIRTYHESQDKRTYVIRDRVSSTASGAD